jgi:hypothetical protein
MLRSLIILVLLMHGIGQIMPFLAAWTNVKLFSGASWMFSSGVGVAGPVGRAFALLGLIALIGFVGGALGLAFGAGWWPSLLIAAAAISLVVALPWPAAWPSGSWLGNVIVDAAVLVWMLTPWGDTLTRAL